jgi:hypothetical protein
MTLGPTNGLTLEDARRTASGYIYHVANGKDPRAVLAAEAEKQLTSQAEATRAQYTLADIWPRYISANKKRWSDRYLQDHHHYAQAGGEI